MIDGRSTTEHGAALPVAGIDVGGSKALGVVGSLGGGAPRIMARRTTGRSLGPDDLVAVVTDLLDDLGRSDEPIESVGIGFPGLVRPGGEVRSSVILDGWDRVPLASMVSVATGLPCRVDNDVNNGARAELRRRTARKSTGAPEDFMFVAVGTGIGGALVLDGSVRAGPSGAAGEVGHLRAGAAGQRRCECGGIGCAHLVSSGRAIERSLGLPQGGLQNEMRRGSTTAMAAVVRAGETLGPVLADAATLLDLPLVVLGGGIGCLSPFVDGARRGFARSAMSEVTSSCRIEAAMAGTCAGAIGAILLFDE